jgi:hypothetical protein
MKKPRELFLSHATPDRELAEALASTLRAHGVPVWFSRTDLAGAQQWHDEIGRALGRCDWFALLLSPAAVRSRWVKRELLFALDRYDGRIVPILLRGCRWEQLSWTLEQLQFVKLAPFEDGCRSLLGLWGLGLDPACLTLPRERGRKA